MVSYNFSQLVSYFVWMNLMIEKYGMLWTMIAITMEYLMMRITVILRNETMTHSYQDLCNNITVGEQLYQTILMKNYTDQKTIELFLTFEIIFLFHNIMMICSKLQSLMCLHNDFNCPAWYWHIKSMICNGNGQFLFYCRKISTLLISLLFPHFVTKCWCVCDLYCEKDHPLMTEQCFTSSIIWSEMNFFTWFWFNQNTQSQIDDVNKKTLTYIAALIT